MFDKLLFLYLILSPICYCGGEDLFRYASRFLMVGTIVMAALSFLFCKPQRKIIPKWPLWLLLFLIAKLYYFPYHWLSMNGIFHVFFGIGLFYLVVNYVKDLRWMYRGVGVAVVINVAYGIISHFGFNPIFKYGGAPAGFFSNNSDLAGYLLLTIPLMTHYLKGFGFLVPFVFSILLLKSYTAIICGAAAGVVLSLRKGLFPIMTLIVIALAAAVLMRGASSHPFKYKLNHRLPYWQEAVKGALRKPMVGYGLGRAVDFTSAIAEGAFTFKSDYFEFGFEVGGVPALVIVGFIFFILFQRYIRAVRSWDLNLISLSLLTFAISLVAQPHFRNPKISPTVMILLGCFYMLTENKRGETNG